MKSSLFLCLVQTVLPQILFNSRHILMSLIHCVYTGIVTSEYTPEAAGPIHWVNVQGMPVFFFPWSSLELILFVLQIPTGQVLTWACSCVSSVRVFIVTWDPTYPGFDLLIWMSGRKLSVRGGLVDDGDWSQYWL
jgi:hypothetical protein